MAKNFPGPYEVRLFYTPAGIQHVQHLNVRLSGDPAPGTAFADIDVLRRDDSAFALDSEVDDWVALLQPFFPSATGTIDFAELWKYEDLSEEASFISAYTIAVAGTSGSSAQLHGEAIYSFRTTEGGIMYVKMLESVTAPGARVQYPAMNAANQALVDAVQLGTSPWLGRDTSYPFAFRYLSPGSNEALFKKRYRP